MDWSAATAVLNTFPMPPGYALEQLTRTDVTSLIDCVRAWYPGAAVSAEAPHLDPRFYDTEVAMQGEALTRRIFPVVVKHNASLVGFVTFEMDALARTVYGRLGAIDPAHRGSGMGMFAPTLLESIARAVHAELVCYFATLKTRHQQVIAERAGFNLVGIIPAHDRDLVPTGGTKRVYEALYCKVLIDSAHVELPGPNALTARTKAVWNRLFGSDEASADPADPHRRPH